MALLRKDLKLGFLAGGTVLVLGVGYVLVSGFFGGDDPAAADPLAFNPETTLDQPLEDQPAGNATPADGASGPDTSGDWGEFGEPEVTRTPTPTQLAAGTLPEDAPVEPQTPDLNGEEAAPLENPIFGNLQKPLPDRSVVTPSVADGSDQAADDDAVETAAGDAADDADAAEKARTHEVATGESFSSIARKYYGDANLFSLIQDANPNVDPARLNVGQVLQIPDRAAAEAERGSIRRTSTADAGENEETTSDDGLHTVRSGETLSSIANKRFGRAALWEEIYELNRDVIGDSPANLKVGMTLKLPK